MNESPHNNLHELASEYFLRELTPAERALLEEGLSSDAALRAQFAELARDEWLLHHVHQVEEENLIPIPPVRSRLGRVAALAACIALLLSAGLFLVTHAWKHAPALASETSAGARARVSELFVLDGDAVTAVHNGAVRAVKLGAELKNGERIAVPPSARLTIRFEGEDTTLRVGGDSSFELAYQDGAKHIELLRGVLEAEVAPQPTNKPMRVVTGDAEAVVLGTVFELLAGEMTRLAVTEGSVRFRSLNGTRQVVVNGGYIAEASRAANWLVEAFRNARMTPVYDGTVNSPGSEKYIVVDPERRSMGLMTFNLGAIDGEIREARLRLRVVQKGNDTGGAGNVRLFRTEPDADWSSGAPVPRTEISHYRGRVGAGMDLEFVIPPRHLSSGVLTLLLTLDRKGNDFWFSSSEGQVAPELTLKIVTRSKP